MVVSRHLRAIKILPITVWVWFRLRFRSPFVSSYKLRKFEKQMLVYLLSANELYPLLAAFYPSLSVVLLMFSKNIKPHRKLIKEMVTGRLI